MRRGDQILAAFLRFHSENPVVWDLFRRFARDAAGAGREHYSANAIFERIRWYLDVEIKSDREVKLNNNFRAYYARMFSATHSDAADLFRTRTLRSEREPAQFPDRQAFVDPPAQDDPELSDILQRAAQWSQPGAQHVDRPS